jgi:hypothetical protein
MIDFLCDYDGLVTIFAADWTYSNVSVTTADEAGVVFTGAKGKLLAVPWVQVKNVEVL